MTGLEHFVVVGEFLVAGAIALVDGLMHAGREVAIAT